MSTLLSDIPLTQELEEHHGAVVGLRRVYRVYGLTDHDIGMFATALAKSGVPAANSTPADYPNLILQDRKCTLAPNENGKSHTAVDIECVYVAKSRAEYGWVWKMNSTLTSTTSQKDRWGALSVGHYYDPLYESDPQFQDREIWTGAEYTMLQPEIEFTGTGVIATNNPLQTVLDWTRAVNATKWGGINAGHLMCVNIEHMPLDLGSTPRKHTFTFTFQGKSDGWTPRVTFIDQRTGRPPFGIVEGIGTYVVDYLYYREYNDFFPNP